MQKSRSLLLCLAGLVFAVVIFGSGLPIPPLDPRAYCSASGEFTWEVNPSDYDGRGEATYRLTRSGKLVWTGKIPFTLCDASVATDGALAGYAYTAGLRGDSHSAPNTDELIVAIIEPNGNLRLKESTPRRRAQYTAGPNLPSPRANGILINEYMDQITIRVNDPDSDRRHEMWWSYRLSTGAVLERRPLVLHDGPRDPVVAVRSAAPVAGTPLILIHYQRNFPDDGHTCYALVDQSLQEVWSLAWPGDDTGTDAKAALLRHQIQQGRKNAILDTSGPSWFAVRAFATSERVTFSVLPGVTPGTWLVTQTSRQQFVESTDKPTPVSMLRRPLELLGTFDFAKDETEPRTAVRDLWQGFELDGSDRIGFLRQETEGLLSFVLVENSGKPVCEISLALLSSKPRSHKFQLSWIEGSRWLVHTEENSVRTETFPEDWLIDAGSGRLEKLPRPDSPDANSTNRHGPNGAVRLHAKWVAAGSGAVSPKDEVVAYDSTGKVRWRLAAGGPYDERHLSFPRAVTITSRNEIAVLDNTRRALQFFDPEGLFLRYISLEKAWGRNPHYPTEISPDRDGGVMIVDFRGKSPLVRMNAEGRVLQEMELKYQDGRTLDAGTAIRVDSQGRIWASDRAALYRFSDQGVVDYVLGAAPAVEKLGNVAALTIDGYGQLYAVDERNGVVHVFDVAGKPVRKLLPAPDDFGGRLGYGTQLTVSAEGETFLSGGASSTHPNRYIHFAADGTRVGTAQLSVDSIAQEWHALPIGNCLLVLGYHAAYLTDITGKDPLTIRRQPDNRWFGHLRNALVATDGSFVIIGAHETSDEQSLNLYSSTGEPIRTLALPGDAGILAANTGAFTGRYFAFLQDKDIRLIDIVSNPGHMLVSPRPADSGDRLFAPWGKNEMWLIDSVKRKVYRYALP